MRWIAILLFILVIPTVQASSDFTKSSSLSIDMDLEAEISASGSTSLSSLNAEVLLVPTDDSLQTIGSIQTTATPEAEISGTFPIIFEWSDFSEEYSFGYQSSITTNHKIYPVPTIKYPLKEIPQEYNQYLQEEEFIDITPEIIQKTSEIIGDETNAYLVVHRIAAWTKTNIQYNLTSLTSKQALKSSWVLENKYGVCDELTSLFISMTRAAGIPARFISGVAYTNVLDDFGNHGWAEVYFPEYGWVPYDVTFGQFGWIDPTHITLSRTLDSSEPSIKYTWRSQGTEISPGGIKTTGEINYQASNITPLFDLEVIPLVDQVGPNSYFPIKVEVENPMDAFLTTQVIIRKAPGIIGGNTGMVVLKPLEKSEYFFIGHNGNELQEGFIYTSQIEAEDSFGSLDKSQIEMSKNYEMMTLEEAQDMIAELQSTETGSSSGQIVVNCKPSKDYFYTFEESAKITCSIRNLGKSVNDLELCLDLVDCTSFSLNNLETKDIEFTISNPQKVHTANLIGNEIDITRHILLSIYDEPSLKIYEINYPQEINYNEELKINLELSAPTLVKNVKIKINDLSTVEVPEILNSKEFGITTNSKIASSGELKIKIEYYDEFGNKYTTTDEYGINVIGAPWYMKLLVKLRSFFA